MVKSETIGKLAIALNAVQKVLKPALKDANNPFFKSKYADLTSVWEACREALTANDLSVIQTTDVAFEQGFEGVVVETILLHNSGEWIMGKLYLKPTKNDPQGIGSAITYGRRYGLQSIVGICPEDDDGEGAMGRKSDGGSTKDNIGGNVPRLATESPKLREVGSIPTPSANIETEKKGKNFKFLEIMQGQKKRIGEKAYYAVLGLHGFEKSSEIIEKETQTKVYYAMLEKENVK